MIVAVAVLASACTTVAKPVAAPGFVRVDQVGYAPGESKHAYLMSARDCGDVRFQVVDGSGRTVFSGTAGPTRVPWNTEFRSVRVLDFSAVKTAGSYRIKTPGAPPSLVFTVDNALFNPIVTSNTRFFQTQRDRAHPAERTATVYKTPRCNEAGTSCSRSGWYPTAAR